MSDFEARLQRLEDIEEIRQLKYRYCAYCDDNYNPDGIAGLFVADAVWNGGPFGVATGQAAIRELFSKAPSQIRFAVHMVVNPIIDVTGDTAVGRWYLWQPTVMRQGDQALWLAAKYTDQYVRTAEGWRFKHLSLDVTMMSPYEAGFGKMQMLPT